MIQLGLCNIDNILTGELSKQFDTVTLKSNDTYVNVIIIDWMPDTNEKHKTQQLILQASLIEKYAKNKKVKIIVFDRYLSITNDEYQWLQKNDVILLEPALNYRYGFNYLPYWIKYKSGHDIALVPSTKKYDIIYDGSPTDNIKDFESYLLKCSKESTNIINIAYTGYINESKTDEYKDNNIIRSTFNYNNSKFSLLIGTPLHYRIGYLHPHFTKILQSDCIPLIPCGHRYFNAMSNIMHNSLDVELALTTYDKLYYGYMMDVYSNIKKFYPEMLVENVVESLKKFVKG